MRAGLDRAAWLGDRLLLLIGRFGGGNEKRQIEGTARLGDRALPLELHARSAPGGDRDAPARDVAIGRLPAGERVDGRPLGLDVRAGKNALSLDEADVSSALTDLGTILRRDLAGLDPETRTELMSLFVEACKPDLEGPEGFRLGMTLFRLREALRERRPRAYERGDPLLVHVDSILAVDPKSYWIEGWIRDDEAACTRLTAVSPEGMRVELLQRLFRYRNPQPEGAYDQAAADSDKREGFVAYFELPAPSRLPGHWVIELEARAGPGFEADAPEVVRDTVAVRDRILAGLKRAGTLSDDLMAAHARPALDRAQSHLTEEPVETTIQHGTPGGSYDVSIVVPLYGRVDFLEQQLVQFDMDPEVKTADLIYVLDSPELAGELESYAADLYELHRIPFRVVVLHRNVGVAAARNAGASAAWGRLLLFLDSDVLPDRPGWLGKMTSWYDSKPDIGALGAKLLYEDDTIQHAGLRFRRDGRSALWESEHYFKGLHRSLPAANAGRPVPAVTGGCLMIDGGLYRELGGFRDTYVRGGFEDADLCLRLAELGRENWYLSDAELYHLEAQSFHSEPRELAVRYNAWLHTHLWGDRMEHLTGGDDRS